MSHENKKRDNPRYVSDSGSESLSDEDPYTDMDRMKILWKRNSELKKENASLLKEVAELKQKLQATKEENHEQRVKENKEEKHCQDHGLILKLHLTEAAMAQQRIELDKMKKPHQFLQNNGNKIDSMIQFLQTLKMYTD